MPAIVRSGLASRPVPHDEDVVDALARIGIGLLRATGKRLLPGGSAPSYVGKTIFECYIAGLA
jgi:hypothetical protein